MSTLHPVRTDGPFSSPNLLQRATPFIGASVWRRQLQRVPRAVHPLPAALALTLEALPFQGPPSSNAAQFVALAIAMSVAFAMEAVPWGRVPRWGETLALLGAVAP